MGWLSMRVAFPRMFIVLIGISTSYCFCPFQVMVLVASEVLRSMMLFFISVARAPLSLPAEERYRTTKEREKKERERRATG